MYPEHNTFCIITFILCTAKELPDTSSTWQPKKCLNLTANHSTHSYSWEVELMQGVLLELTLLASDIKLNGQGRHPLDFPMTPMLAQGGRQGGQTALTITTSPSVGKSFCRSFRTREGDTGFPNGPFHHGETISVCIRIWWWPLQWPDMISFSYGCRRVAIWALVQRDFKYFFVNITRI